MIETSQEAVSLHVPAGTSFGGGRRHALKHDNTFAVFDGAGDIVDVEGTADGLYHADTRIVSRMTVSIDGQRPLLLSTTAQEDNETFRADLTNSDRFAADGSLVFERELLQINRLKFVWSGRHYERILVRNFDRREREVELGFGFAADFADLFEVRGERRLQHGTLAIERTSSDAIEYRYTGLDASERITQFEFSPSPDALDTAAALYSLRLQPGEAVRVFARAGLAGDVLPWSARAFFGALRLARRATNAKLAGSARAETSNPSFNAVLERAASDLAMLVTSLPTGPYPCAGIPWFATPFGRDGIVTALLTLWHDPAIARGVLAFLAATQAREVDERRDAEPGKILHEMRDGEMARLGEVPFGRYYGSVDATPLFVVLLGAYHERTGDVATVRELWPNAVAALQWIDRYGDRDGDGFVEYGRKTGNGLANQGWKDSNDAIFHADGTLATGPIAVCEVQSYTFGAKRAAAELARVLGLAREAERLEAEAEALRERFEAAFWSEELGTYALALDGDKRACLVVASNAGHTLLCGIASPERAARVARTLLAAPSFSGWGIRTVATGAARYNPMSYHNGSVWPHDNALIALGFARYGFREALGHVFAALAAAASYMDLYRMPELFCGFARRRGNLPTLYPVACSPQAWAAVAPLALLGATLGLRFTPGLDEIRFERPALPRILSQVTLRGLRAGNGKASVDVSIQRYGNEVALTVLARRGATRVTITHEPAAGL